MRLAVYKGILRHLSSKPLLRPGAQSEIKSAVDELLSALMIALLTLVLLEEVFQEQVLALLDLRYVLYPAAVVGAIRLWLLRDRPAARQPLARRRQRVPRLAASVAIFAIISVQPFTGMASFVLAVSAALAVWIVLKLAFNYSSSA